MAQYGAAVEYALHTLLNLSFASGGTMPSARDLADFQRLPLAFIRKLLTQMEAAALVIGGEGVRGGWRLRRAPAEISVLAVVEAVHGREPLFACREVRARCALWPDNAPPRAARAGVCEIHAVMLTAERAQHAQLAAVSLADIATRVSAKAPRFAERDVPTWLASRAAARTSQARHE